MGRGRDLARPKAVAFLRELRRLAPRADYPVVGQPALRAWFHEHGFRRRSGAPLSWDQLKAMQRRCGVPWGWHCPAIGLHRGRPVSSHLLLLHWCMVQGEKLGPPRTEHWQPSEATRRQRAGKSSTTRTSR
jgi:hypothetical protein